MGTHHLGGGLLLALLGSGLSACGEDGSEDFGVAKSACYATVSKTATTNRSRAWTWEISKSVTPTEMTLAQGETGKAKYEVLLMPTMNDTFVVTGDITLSNAWWVDVDVMSIVDTILEEGKPTSIPVAVSCPSYVVPASGTVTCTYRAELPDAMTRTNRVEVVSRPVAASGEPLDEVTMSAEAEIAFDAQPDTETDECVMVSDTMAGALGEICAEDEVLSWSYEWAFGPYATCGERKIDNTASFVTNDTDTQGQDTATLQIDVPCGCTLTFGYWKNHADPSQERFDDTWLMLDAAGANKLFFNGLTYRQVLGTSPKGDAYYILAHQYIAAELNRLAGADSSSISTAFTKAALCLKPLSGCMRREMLEYAGTLDSYNNGLLGPGHCSE